MTDNEIMKVLAEHIAFSLHCDSAYSTINITLLKDALDLINRQKAEIESDKAKKEICAEVIDRQDKEIERLQGILLAFMDEVAEVKHGEWKWGYGVGGQYGIWCTNCGAGYVDSPNAEWIAQEHDYCGKCGAKMDGKEKDHE